MCFRRLLPNFSTMLFFFISLAEDIREFGLFNVNKHLDVNSKYYCVLSNKQARSSSGRPFKINYSLTCISKLPCFKIRW